jgi:hypothetical protein
MSTKPPLIPSSPSFLESFGKQWDSVSSKVNAADTANVGMEMLKDEVPPSSSFSWLHVPSVVLPSSETNATVTAPPPAPIAGSSASSIQYVSSASSPVNTNTDLSAPLNACSDSTAALVDLDPTTETGDNRKASVESIASLPEDASDPEEEFDVVVTYSPQRPSELDDEFAETLDRILCGAQNSEDHVGLARIGSPKSNDAKDSEAAEKTPAFAEFDTVTPAESESSRSSVKFSEVDLPIGTTSATQLSLIDPSAEESSTGTLSGSRKLIPKASAKASANPNPTALLSRTASASSRASIGTTSSGRKQFDMDLDWGTDPAHPTSPPPPHTPYDEAALAAKEVVKRLGVTTSFYREDGSPLKLCDEFDPPDDAENGMDAGDDTDAAGDVGEYGESAAELDDLIASMTSKSGPVVADAPGEHADRQLVRGGSDKQLTKTFSSEMFRKALCGSSRPASQESLIGAGAGSQGGDSIDNDNDSYVDIDRLRAKLDEKRIKHREAFVKKLDRIP